MNSKYWIAVTLVLAACSSTNESWQEPEPENAERAPSANTPVDTTGLRRDCFFVRDANNWENINRVNLVVYAPRSRPYLVLISPPSNSIRNTVPLRFEGNNGRVCGRAGERLVVGRGGSGRTHGIFGVWRLDDESLARVLGAKPSPESESGEIDTDEVGDDAAEDAGADPATAVPADDDFADSI